MSSSTMWRAFNPIRVVVISLLLGGCFIEGVVLEFTKSDAGIVMMFVSMAIFRFYMASEWALFMKETQPYSPNNRYSGRTARGFTIEFITTTALYILSITIEATTHSRSLYRGLNALIVSSFFRYKCVHADLPGNIGYICTSRLGHRRLDHPYSYQSYHYQSYGRLDRS